MLLTPGPGGAVEWLGEFQWKCSCMFYWVPWVRFGSYSLPPQSQHFVSVSIVEEVVIGICIHYYCIVVVN